MNTIIYCIYALLFALSAAIDSVLYSMVYSIIVDKTHLQNINTSIMIFTKQTDLYEMILQKLNRGVIHRKGTGEYTDTYAIYTLLSKYEVQTLQQKLYQKDLNAFVITEQDQILKNYEVRL